MQEDIIKNNTEYNYGKTKTDKAKSGSVLIGVLIIAAITALLGIARLSLYKNQVEQRTKRSERLRVQTATRTGVAVLKSADTIYSLPQVSNHYTFASDAWPNDFVLTPATRIFPHAATEFDAIEQLSVSWTDEEGITRKGLELGNGASKPDDIERKHIDIPVSSVPDILWDSSPYGLNYSALYASIYNSPNDPSDIIRFAITPLGMPLTQEKGGPAQAPYAIWLEQITDKNQTSVNVLCRELNNTQKVIYTEEIPAAASKGIHLNKNRLALLSLTPVKPGLEGIYPDKEHASSYLSAHFTTNFLDQCKKSGGIRLSLEVQIKADRSKIPDKTKAVNRFWAVTTTHPYHYEIFVYDKKSEEMRRTTVVHVSSDTPPKVMTLDTHH